MTIAEGIPKEVFPKLKEGLSGFKGKIEFEVDSTYLYKRKSGSKVWEEAAEIKFS